MAKRSDDRMVWIDLEMTGLDPDKERIIEIAVLVTDSELELVAEGPELVVHQSEELLAAMDEWNTSHHGESGLTERVRQSTLSEADAEAQVLHFLKKHVKEGTAPLAGNSVWQDRRFLCRYMPKIDEWLHYRIIDVSTIKELARRWYPTALAQAPVKQNTHRALDDIRESIAELAYYRGTVFAKHESAS